MQERSIEDWCEYFDFKKYEIIDGVLNVNGNVILQECGLKKIPIQFGIVNGYFHCPYNELITLKGSPIEVSLHLNCYHNKLISLEGGPIKVGGNYCCEYNQLTSLEGAPKEIGQGFNCSHNILTSLENGPTKVGGNFYCKNNPVWNEYMKYNSYNHYMRSVKLNLLLSK
jgi:hypothetical protein